MALCCLVAALNMLVRIFAIECTCHLFGAGTIVHCISLHFPQLHIATRYNSRQAHLLGLLAHLYIDYHITAQLLTMLHKYSSDAESAASQESAPMDESDSEAGSPAPDANGAAADDDDKYPYEGMFESAQEKEDIMSMREVERESILAERAQEIERQRQTRILRQLVSAGDNKKRKANDADLEETHRKTSRQRTKLGGSKVGEQNAGIESLRRARAEKSERQRRLADDRERNKKSNGLSRGSPDHDQDESDVEWGESKRHRSRSRTPEVKEIPLADLRDIERVRLGRSRFAQICFWPRFEETITGCFARISIGPDPRSGDGANQYRMALIKRMIKRN